jgi:prepilin-type N-terminal cleavage/methylation domain-containing protein
MNSPVILMKWLIQDRSQRKLSSCQGFTLIELLVVVAISALVISGLLWFVVQLTSNEKKEAAITATEQEMQAALDYMISDLREAVYIYDGQCNPLNSASCPSYNSYVPSSLQQGTTGIIPVLAFWKTVEVDDLTNTKYKAMCNGTSGTGDPADSLTNPTTVNSNATAKQRLRYQDCQNIFRQRHTYNLIIYAQETNSSTSWSGLSRIKRYELDKYSPNTLDSSGASNNTTMARTQGYVNPAEIGNSLFANWPLVQAGTTIYNCQSSTTSGLILAGYQNSNCGAYDDGTNVESLIEPGVPSASGNVQVLVDFVDSPTASGYTASCSDTTNYSLIPRNATTSATLSNSFYACIRNQSLTQGEVQDVILNLRGNARNRNAAFGNVDQRTTTLQTQLTLRSVLDKNPAN